MAKTTTKPAAAKKQDYKDMNISELEKLSLTIREDSVILKRNMHMGDVPNIRAYKFKKRELARVLTALNSARVKGKE